MLKAAGFEITKCETKDKPDEFDSIQVLKGKKVYVMIDIIE